MTFSHWSPIWACSALSAGSSLRQYPHQEAQKVTITTLPRWSARSTAFDLPSLPRAVGAIAPISGALAWVEEFAASADEVASTRASRDATTRFIRIRFHWPLPAARSSLATPRSVSATLARMPELPEVETTRRGLAPHVEGRRVASVVLR